MARSLPIRLTRTRPDGQQVELGTVHGQGRFDLPTSIGYQARAPGYLTGRFILRSTDPVQVADVSLARPTARVLGITFAVLGTAGLIATAYSAFTATTVPLVPCLYCGQPAVGGYWTAAGVSAALTATFLIPAIALLVRGPTSRVVVRADDAHTMSRTTASP